MTNAWIKFEFQLKRDGEILSVHNISFDACDYLCSHLKCNSTKLGDVLKNTKDEDIVDIAKWAASMCSFMYNGILDYAQDLTEEIAKDEAEKISSDQNEVFFELCDNIRDQINHKITASYISIDGKIYKGM